MISQHEEFEVFHGKNYRVLKTRDFGNIVFGCPPGIIKEFARRREALPSQFVIPYRTFIKGRNNFDFEFIVYTYLFIKRKKEKLTIYCLPEQERRFRIILGETLFGPSFQHIVQAQLRKFERQHTGTGRDRAVFEQYTKRIAGSAALAGLFSGLLRAHAGRKAVEKKIGGFLRRELPLPIKLKRGARNVYAQLARDYVVCAQLRQEMSLFALAPENKRDDFIDNIVNFRHFDENGLIHLQSPTDKNKQLKMSQIKPSLFYIYSGDRKKCEIDIQKFEMPSKEFAISPITKPFMGVTFLGVGSGFTPDRRNSCLVVWSEGRGIMIDVLNESNVVARGYGVNEQDISYMFLSHVHSDHDAGIIERILYGQRVKLISTRIIFESFLRKLEAITCFPQAVIENFCDFIEVEPHKPLKLPGFQSSYFIFDYSLHSIPTGRFCLVYKDGRKERVISHSGDSKYSVEKIMLWYEMGVFSKERRDDILGFIWDADLIIHDVGGGDLHTELDDLVRHRKALAKKIVLVHQDQAPKQGVFRFGVEGQTEVLLPVKRSSGKEKGVKGVKEMLLFQNLRKKQFLEMFGCSKVRTFKSGETVFMQNELGSTFYVILEGFAEIIINGDLYTVYEKGDFFGELAITTDNPRRRATVRAKGYLTVLEIDRKYYKKFNLPSIQDEFYKLGNYFSDMINPSLLAFLAFGNIMHWRKDETIISFGALDRDMYVLLSGRVEVLDQNHNTMTFMGPGDIMGEIACLKNVPRTANVVARSDEVYAVSLSNAEVQRVFKMFPSFYGTVYQKMRKLEANFR